MLTRRRRTNHHTGSPSSAASTANGSTAPTTVRSTATEAAKALHPPLSPAKKPVAGIVTISAPVFLYPMVSSTLPLIEQWLPGLRAPANFAAWQGNVVGYKSTTIGAVNVVLDLLARVRGELEAVNAPLLVVHSVRDLTVPVDSAREIHARASSGDKRLELIDAGSHLMTIEPNLRLIDAIIVDFLKRLESEACPEGR